MRSLTLGADPNCSPFSLYLGVLVIKPFEKAVSMSDYEAGSSARSSNHSTPDGMNS